MSSFHILSDWNYFCQHSIQFNEEMRKIAMSNEEENENSNQKQRISSALSNLALFSKQIENVTPVLRIFDANTLAMTKMVAAVAKQVEPFIKLNLYLQKMAAPMLKFQKMATMMAAPMLKFQKQLSAISGIFTYSFKSIQERMARAITTITDVPPLQNISITHLKSFIAEKIQNLEEKIDKLLEIFAEPELSEEEIEKIREGSKLKEDIKNLYR